MDQNDLTASHWDDVVLSRPFDSSHILVENGFQEDILGFNKPAQRNRSSEDRDEENSDQEEREDDDEEETNDQSNDEFTSKRSTVPEYDAESEQKAEIRAAELKKHRSQLMNDLTSGQDIEDVIDPKEAPPVTGDSLFKETTSPIKILQTSSSIGESIITDLLSSARVVPKARLFTRSRKYSPKVTVQHLDSNPLGPLGSEKSTNEPKNPLTHREELVKEADAPLYQLQLKQSPSSSITQESKSIDPGSQSSNIQEVRPVDMPKKPVADPESPLEITVGDPMKVGDITTAHIVYTVTTRNKTTPEDVKEVTRRYRDFRWIYHQLQHNHPGMIIPPPPTKQTYIGRFNENFIESRRLMLEKMLTKIAAKVPLGLDPDFLLFLENPNFAAESQDRERMAGTELLYEGDDFSEPLTEPSTTGFMSSLFLMSTKTIEPNDFIKEKKGYIDDLESNLKNFEKALEAIGNQRGEIITLVDQIATISEELASIEISKKTGDILAEFSEIHTKLRESYDRTNMQEQLTLGFTIEEYLRIIGLIKQVFAMRSKVYSRWQQCDQDFKKKQSNLDKIHRKSSQYPDKVKLLEFEVEKLSQKSTKLKDQYDQITDTIKEELEKFEYDKIDDFRNLVEIFIELLIEAQKESIELWESFYEKQLR